MNDDIKVRVGEIKILFGLNQREIANMMGITAQSLSRAIRKKLSSNYMHKVCDVLPVRYEWLCGGEGSIIDRKRLAKMKESLPKEDKLAKALEKIDSKQEPENHPEVYVPSSAHIDTIKDVELLQQRIDMMSKLLNEKDKQLYDKDEQIKMLRDIVSARSGFTANIEP